MFGRCLNHNYWVREWLFVLGIILFLPLKVSAAAQSIVSVQTGDHDEFIRISLAWPQEVNFDYSMLDNGFEVRFFYKAELLIDRLVKTFPGSYVKHEGNETILFIQISPNRQFLAKSFGTVTYLDVYKAEQPGPITHIPKPKPVVTEAAKAEEAKQEKADVDLQNLFRKVVDYLDVIEADSTSTVIRYGDNGFLIKYPDAPIAVYADNDKTYIVVGSSTPPNFQPKLLEAEPINLISASNGFALQLNRRPYVMPKVTKYKDGWRVEFSRQPASGTIPLVVTQESETLRIQRSGLFDPVEIEGLLVFCTLDPNVFSPFKIIHSNGEILNTGAGLAVRLDQKEILSIDRDVIQFSQTSSNDLPYERRSLLQFEDSQYKGPKFAERKKEIVSAIMQDLEVSAPKQKELIHLYVSNLFGYEAVEEIKSYKTHTNNKDKDLEQMALLQLLGKVVEGAPLQGSLEALFPFVASSLEALAWYSFAAAVSTDSFKLQPYVVDRLMVDINQYIDPLKSFLLLRLADILVTQGVTGSASGIIEKINDKELNPENLLLKQYLQLKLKKNPLTEADRLELERLLHNSGNPAFIASVIVDGGLIHWKNKNDRYWFEMLDQNLPLLEGHPIHQRAIECIVEYYISLKNYMQVLEKCTLMQKYFPSGYKRLIPRVRNIIDGIVRNKLYEKMGIIQTLNIFDTFIDAVPANGIYLDFILQMVDQLDSIGLATEAIGLLEKFMAREDVLLNQQDQLAIFMKILDLHIKNNAKNKAEELLKQLENKTGLSKKEENIINFLKAKLLVLEGNKEAALAQLASVNLFEGLVLKSDLMWEFKNWSGAADAIEQIIEAYPDKLEAEKKERYIVHLAAALVLNEQKFKTKNIGRQKTSLTLQQVAKKYEGVLDKYKSLLSELVFNPHDSLQDTLTKTLLNRESAEIDRLDTLFKELKSIPTQ